MSAKQDYIKAIRLELRDFEALNELLRRKEHENCDIEFALDATLSDANAKTPVTTYTLASFPDPQVLIQGTKARLLRTVAHLLARNVLDGSKVGHLTQIKLYKEDAAEAKQEYWASLAGLKQRIFNNALLGATIDTPPRDDDGFGNEFYG